MRGRRAAEGGAAQPKRGAAPEWPRRTGIINEAIWDRLLRGLVGLTMLYLGWSGVVPGLLGALLKIFGMLPLVTGLLGWDPLYAIFGWGTHRRGHR